GIALKAQGKLDKAIDAYLEAIKLDPKLPYAHGNLGDAFYRQEKLDDAIPCYREAIQLDSQSIWFWQCLGWCLYRTGNWRNSIEALELSCKRQEGGTGDAGQWIVLALAHARLAAQPGLPEKEREHHQAEARRRYEQADKLIDSWWPARPDDSN